MRNNMLNMYRLIALYAKTQLCEWNEQGND